MRLRIFTEPQQGANYEDLLRVAQTAEKLGFDGFFRSDHYLRMGSVSGLPGPTDTWMTIGALARETERLRLGTLMTAATFRLPGPLAVAVAQADQMSGGRVELGIGTGWYEDEHRAYGIPFGSSFSERFERLSEQLEIIRGMWTTPVGETFSYDGRHYTLERSPALPKPVQRPHPPILMGGFGKKRTPRLAARYADELNTPFLPVDHFREVVEAARAACERIDRDPASLAYSAALVVCCGRDEAEFHRRARAIGRAPDDLRRSGAAGTPGEVLDRLAEFEKAGASCVYLQVLDLIDLEHLHVLAEGVLAPLRA